MKDKLYKSERGFDRLPEIKTDYGDTVSVYESSAAKGPHLWLRIDRHPMTPEQIKIHHDFLLTGTTAHLSLEQAQEIADQLLVMIEKVKNNWRD